MFGAFLTWLHVSDYRSLVFWTLKDTSLKINSLALNNNFFSHRNGLQNGVNALPKTVFKDPVFCQKKKKKKKKPSRFRVVWTMQFCSNFTSMWSKYLSNNVWRDFWLPMSALATVAGKNFNGKFTAKFDFPHARVFYITIVDGDIGSLKSLHTLFDKYLDHMLVKFEQNRMGWTIQNFELFGKKWLTILTKFWRHFERRYCDRNNSLMINY